MGRIRARLSSELNRPPPPRWSAQGDDTGRMTTAKPLPCVATAVRASAGRSATSRPPVVGSSGPVTSRTGASVATAVVSWPVPSTRKRSTWSPGWTSVSAVGSANRTGTPTRPEGTGRPAAVSPRPGRDGDPADGSGVGRVPPPAGGAEPLDRLAAAAVGGAHAGGRDQAAAAPTHSSTATAIIRISVPRPGRRQRTGSSLGSARLRRGREGAGTSASSVRRRRGSGAGRAGG